MMKQKVWKGTDSRAPCTFGMGIEEVEMCLYDCLPHPSVEHLPLDGPKASVPCIHLGDPHQR